MKTAMWYVTTYFISVCNYLINIS